MACGSAISSEDSCAFTIMAGRAMFITSCESIVSKLSFMSFARRAMKPTTSSKNKTSICVVACTNTSIADIPFPLAFLACDPMVRQTRRRNLAQSAVRCASILSRAFQADAHSHTARVVAQFGSALDWGSRGRRFKSCPPDQLFLLTQPAYSLARLARTIFSSDECPCITLLGNTRAPVLGLSFKKCVRFTLDTPYSDRLLPCGKLPRNRKRTRAIQHALRIREHLFRFRPTRWSQSRRIGCRHRRR